MSGPDLSQLSDEDLKAVSSGAMDKVSEAGLRSLAAPAPKPSSPAAPDAPPEPTPMLTQIGHAALDAGSTVARAAGDVYGAGKNLLQGNDTSMSNTDRALQTGEDFTRPFGKDPFSHAPDVPNAVERAVSRVVGFGPGLLSQATQPIVDAAKPTIDKAMATPEGQLVSDVAKPAGEIAQGVGTLAAVKPGLTAVRDGLDVGVNALNTPTAAQKTTLASNPKVGQLRADGFKITANDMRAVNPSAKDADIHGVTRSEPVSTDAIQRHNTATATQNMATDVGLPNTRAINDAEVQERMSQEGKVYGQVGEAIGTGRAPTANLDHDLALAAPRAATADAAAANQKLVAQYRDQFKAGFNGPDAVETVKELRNEAHTRMASNDANEQSLGRTQIGIANAVENEMMRQLPVQAQDLRAAFPQARMQLAKLNELNAVTEGGQIVPAKVLQLKRSGSPLSGAASAVANAADVAPESMSRAGGTPATQLSAPTHTGIVRDVTNEVRGVLNKLPGRNPATDAYQAAHYGPTGGVGATPPPSAAPGVSRIPPPVDLQAPPGEVGRVPDQGEMFDAPYSPVARPPAPELAVGQGRAAAARSTARGGPSGYGDELIEHPNDSLSVGQGRGTDRPSLSRSGPSGYGDVAPPDATLSVGQGKGGPTLPNNIKPPKGLTREEREEWERDLLTKLTGSRK